MPRTRHRVLISWLMVARNVLLARFWRLRPRGALFQLLRQSQDLALLFFLFRDILANSQH